MRFRRRTRVLAIAVAAVLAGPIILVAELLSATPGAASPPPDFQTSLVVGDGLDGPSGFEIAPDGRIFVLERTGMIKIIKNGRLLPQPFADLPSEAIGDRGLIGIAFDPDFGVANHHVYFYYTGHDLLNHLVRFDASEDVGADGPFPLLQTQSPSQLLHVGGTVAFGPDGKLYFAIGDNGTPENAQNLANPHGKILRINRDGSIPTDNPFYGQPGKLGAIWAYGFRNPWRFQFDSATGALYGADVGDFTARPGRERVRRRDAGRGAADGPVLQRRQPRPDGDPLTYLWDFGDGTTSTAPNPTKTFTSKGVYTVRLTVSAGPDQTPAQPIVVQVGIPPTLTVAAPVDGALYRAGNTITYNAFASDAAGFDLNDADIKTVVRLHHGTHYHPFAGPLTGRAGSFTIPTTGEASADTSYEITVTATDGNGLSTSKTVTYGRARRTSRWPRPRRGSG
jgi:hypothetical protein